MQYTKTAEMYFNTRTTRINEIGSQIPNRESFQDQKMRDHLVEIYAAGKPFLFFPIHVAEIVEKNSYKLLVSGTALDGNKAVLLLDNINVFIDILVPAAPPCDKKEKQDVTSIFMAEICEHLQVNKFRVLKTEIVEGRPFTKYYETPIKFIRVYFDNNYTRKSAIKYFDDALPFTVFDVNGESSKQNLKCDVFSNDMTQHVRKVSRDYSLNFVDWIVVTGYKSDTRASYVKDRVKYFLETEITNVFNYERAVPEFTPKQVATKAKIATRGYDKFALLKDPAIMCVWDIETYDYEPSGHPPLPEHVYSADGVTPRAVMFMNGISFYRVHSDKPLISYVISTLPMYGADPQSGRIAIQCKDQEEIIKVSYMIEALMMPDMKAGFNDGNYDTPFFKNRVERFKLTKNLGNLSIYHERFKMIQPRFHTEEHIKLEAGDDLKSTIISNPATVSMDALIMFRQLNPRDSRYSLNHFLEKAKLRLKDDIKYDKMNEIFKLATELMRELKTDDIKELIDRISSDQSAVLLAKVAPKMSLEYALELLSLIPKVGEYCVNDADSVQRLFIKATIVGNCREKSKLAFTSFYDAVYYANGSKCRNLAAERGAREGIFFKTRTIVGEEDDHKYPGGFVQPPIKGLYKSHRFEKMLRIINEFGADSKDPTIKLIRDKITTNVFEVSSLASESNEPRRRKFTFALADPQDPKFVQELRQIDPGVIAALVPEHIARVNNDYNVKCDRPITGLDFSSLYPSLIMAYNLSAEKCIPDGSNPQICERIINASGTTARDRVLHDFSFTYASEKQNKQTRICGSFVRHNNDPSKMGLYPKILKDLFDARKALKGNLEYFSQPQEFFANLLESGIFPEREITSADQTREWIQAYINRECDNAAATVKNPETKPETRKNSEDYLKLLGHIKKFIAAEYSPTNSWTLRELFNEHIVFNYNYYNAKQLALKVFMNTFYGETGNKKSPFFVVEVAGAITTSGQKNIKMVKKFVEESGYSVKYGDTDSLYVACPEQCFAEADINYEQGKITREEYWTKMIEITMVVLKDFKDKVNAQLERDNGTKFLSMAYEEVLFPAFFMGMKKYAGIQHMNVVKLDICRPGMDPEKFAKSNSLFKRGLEVVKRDASDFAKKNVFGALCEIFSMNSVETVHDIVFKYVDAVAVKKWQPEMFAKYKKYRLPIGSKPGNVSVIAFVKRFTKLLSENPKIPLDSPSIGSRFAVVLVKRPQKYDDRGRKIAQKASDKYETIDATKCQEYKDFLGETLDVDMDHYCRGELAGNLARLLTYHHDFTSATHDDPKLFKAEDAIAVKTIKKTLGDYYMTGQKKTSAVNDESAEGKARKFLFRAAMKHYTTKATNVKMYKFMLDLATQDYDPQLPITAYSRLITKAVEVSAEHAKQRAGMLYGTITTAKNFRRSTESLLCRYVDGRNSVLNIRERWFALELKRLELILQKSIGDVIPICYAIAAKIKDAIAIVSDKLLMSTATASEIENEIATILGDVEDHSEKFEPIGRAINSYLAIKTIVQLDEQFRKSVSNTFEEKCTKVPVKPRSDGAEMRAFMDFLDKK